MERYARRASGDLATILAGSQIRRQFFLGVEYSPLNGPDRDLSCGGDLVIFPLFDETQFHDFAFTGIQESHPVQEFECRNAGSLGADCGESIRGVLKVYSLHFAGLSPIMPTESISGDLE